MMINLLLLKEFSQLRTENFTERLQQVNLAKKNDVADFVKQTYFDEKLNIDKKLLEIKQNLQRLKRD